MRKILIVLTSLLLTACVDDSASYYADGGPGNHALTLRRVQPHFWSGDVTVELIMSRWPDCQRRLQLTQGPGEEVEIELFSSGDNLWTLRSGKDMWQVESETCTQFAEVKGEIGEPIGIFRVDAGKFVFEPAINAAAPAGAEGAGAAEAQPAPAAPQ
ncbi:hypothetical protein HSX11_24490 [Oxalobacteraceae bacterium]|nr:hypothetical protein [Oxalobacteraceae bacterium]